MGQTGRSDCDPHGQENAAELLRFSLVDISGHRLVAVSFDVAYILDLQGRKADYPIQQFKASERITGIHLNSSTLKFSCLGCIMNIWK